MAKKNTKLKILVLFLVIITVIPIFSLLLAEMTFNNQNSATNITKNNMMITIPFKPGDQITLQHVLTSTIENQSAILDTEIISMTIENISFPYIETDKGPIPIELIMPVLPARDPINPHFLYHSFYLNDWSCMYLVPSENGNEYDIFPKSGCTKYTGSVSVDKKGVLQEAKLVTPTNSGLIIEYLYVASYTSTGTTEIQFDPNNYICFGPESFQILYTAPGGYIIENEKLQYVGEVNITSSELGIVLAKDDIGECVWHNITTGAIKVPDNTTIFVASNLFMSPTNETNVLYVNGTKVAQGGDIITWLKNKYG